MKKITPHTCELDSIAPEDYKPLVTFQLLLVVLSNENRKPNKQVVILWPEVKFAEGSKY